MNKSMSRFTFSLSFKNLRRRLPRTLAMALIVAFLSFSVFAGSVIVTSLRNGLKSYESRLGADVVVVPYEARTKGKFESILLQGIPGMFYMDEDDFEKIKTIDGVEIAAPQFYLATASAGCCSVSVQVIGFDPETDFTVQPWIKTTYADDLGDLDIIVGSELTVPKDGHLTFYNTDCRVVARLDKTGTGLDTAVYANMNTIRKMIENAQALNFTSFDAVDPSHAVSSVMIKVADGYDPEKVAGDINIYVRHVEASESAAMLSGISGGLGNVAGVIRILIVMIWILAIIILAAAFAMISHERAKEFAVLRVAGASRSMIFRLLLTESALISAIGAVVGLVLSCLVVFPFSSVISSRLEMPYLMPGLPVITAFAAGAFLLSVLAGSVTAAISALRVSRQDAAFILREAA